MIKHNLCANLSASILYRCTKLCKSIGERLHWIITSQRKLGKLFQKYYTQGTMKGRTKAVLLLTFMLIIFDVEMSLVAGIITGLLILPHFLSAFINIFSDVLGTLLVADIGGLYAFLAFGGLTLALIGILFIGFYIAYKIEEITISPLISVIKPLLHKFGHTVRIYFVNVHDAYEQKRFQER